MAGRHPSLWPRMKVRGRRRRALAARRHVNVDYYPSVIAVFDPANPGRTTTFTPVHPSDPRPKFALTLTTRSDGVGRVVHHSPPPPPPRETWSLSFTMSNVNTEALDAIFGRKQEA